jgi:hypothetical protein
MDKQDEVSYRGLPDHLLRQLANDVQALRNQRDRLEALLMDEACDCEISENVYPKSHGFSCHYRRIRDPL